MKQKLLGLIKKTIWMRTGILIGIWLVAFLFVSAGIINYFQWNNMVSIPYVQSSERVDGIIEDTQFCMDGKPFMILTLDNGDEYCVIDSMQEDLFLVCKENLIQGVDVSLDTFPFWSNGKLCSHIVGLSIGDKEIVPYNEGLNLYLAAAKGISICSYFCIIVGGGLVCFLTMVLYIRRVYW